MEKIDGQCENRTNDHKINSVFFFFHLVSILWVSVQFCKWLYRLNTFIGRIKISIGTNHEIQMFDTLRLSSVLLIYHYDISI